MRRVASAHKIAVGVTPSVKGAAMIPLSARRIRGLAMSDDPQMSGVHCFVDGKAVLVTDLIPKFEELGQCLKLPAADC